jgi:hypothetical protein
MDNTQPNLTLTSVADDIFSAHKWFSEQAARQINTALTFRNWVIGMYIREYEQRGADRAMLLVICHKPFLSVNIWSIFQQKRN